MKKNRCWFKYFYSATTILISRVVRLRNEKYCVLETEANFFAALQKIGA
jgi:hypothetical protein